MTVAHLFVYGTLLPGDVRWHLLEPFVVDEGWPDHVAGTLHDTGLGYPAARFEPTDDHRRVLGTTFSLLDVSRSRALEVLDEVEGTVAGLYRRVVVRTGRGIDAWAYAYGSGLDLTPIPTGRWADRARPDPAGR